MVNKHHSSQQKFSKCHLSCRLLINTNKRMVKACQNEANRVAINKHTMKTGPMMNKQPKKGHLQHIQEGHDHK